MHTDMERVIKRGWRMIRSPKRKRHLRKRGERIYWSHYLHCWIWEKEKCPPTTS